MSSGNASVQASLDELRGNRANSPWPDVRVINPDQAFAGVVLITVPHMDDEALACGGTIAKLSDKHRIHLVYATDGTQAPEPILPWIDTVSRDLGALRRRESVAAMTRLGVPEGNLYFLDLPERRLESHYNRLRRLIRQLIDRIKPDHVLTPFRFDRHRDHIAVNRAVTAVCRTHDNLSLTEYFVYHYWKLLPRRDVRRYIRPGEMFQVDITDVSAHKRSALDCFTSQTTRFYSWQARPNLTPALLDGVCREPELFLRYRIAVSDASVFEGPVTWIRLAHRLESPLKRLKDRVVAVARRPFTVDRSTAR